MADEGLTETDKTQEPKRNDKARGRSGTLVASSEIETDYLRELNGIEGQKTFETMTRSDSQIRKVYHAVNNPLKSAKWDIEPASDDEQDLKVAALIQKILFEDIPRGWKGKLDEILTFPWRGHSVFEVVHANRVDKILGPYTGLANLGFRDQKTLDKWNFDKDGNLISIHQKQQGDIEVDTDMASDTLLIFYNERLGSDSGFPFCRMLYGNYKRKLLYKQLQAIGIERTAISVPILTVPKDIKPDSSNWADAEAQLAAFTLAEDAYFMLPEGWVLTFNTSSTFNPEHVQSAIKAENEEIVGSIVGMFLEMGIGGNSGNQAGTSVSSSVFQNGIQYLADKICDVINLELIPNLVRLNFGDTIDVLPKMVCSGISEEDGKMVMEIVTGYVEKGVITVDEQLEDWARKANNLPKKMEGSLMDNGENKSTLPDDDNTPEPKDKTVEKEVVAELSMKELHFAEKPNVIPALIESQAKKINAVIKERVTFSGNKMIADIVARYKQLPESRKQDSTSVKLGGQAKFRDGLKKVFSETVSLSIAQAKKEVGFPTLTLSEKPDREILFNDKFITDGEIKLSTDLEKYPTYIQLLISKQAQMIQEQTLSQMQAAIQFTFSAQELVTKDVDVIKQSMEESLTDMIDKVNIKGDDVSSLLTNEGRNAVFFDDDVIETIASYTFMNGDPKTPICRSLAGKTFNTNDASSLAFTPPLHHGCKSYLRANLKVSKYSAGLEITTLSPTAEEKKGITL